jgi:uncharacterized Zn finger protein (UPF0148 family)
MLTELCPKCGKPLTKGPDGEKRYVSCEAMIDSLSTTERDLAVFHRQTQKGAANRADTVCLKFMP